MAEKTNTKKVEAAKESYKSPQADAAEKIKDNPTKEKLVEELGKVMKKEKQEFEDTKKTVEAHGEFSEEEAEKKAKDTEGTTKKMIEKETKEKESQPEKKENKEKPTKKRRHGEVTREEIISGWEPITKLGEEVKTNKIKDLDEVLDAEKKILEPEIVDYLVHLKSDLISIGQSKGKFGGGKRRAWRQTQRKTKEENVPTFSTMAVVGDEKGHVGIGSGKAKETLPARDKAIRKAKLNVIKVYRTCAGFDCACSEKHTIPFKVSGKAGSVRVTLIPASQGTGLVAGSELKKILGLAGIKDVYTKTQGRKRTSFNLAKACIDALKKTTRRKK